jgi:hypothetical protein
VNFIGLKSLESDIIKNESLLRNISKFIKSVNGVFEVFKLLKDKFDRDRDDSKLRELYKSIIEIKATYNVNPNAFIKRLDNMNSLTLRSEYSEDKSDLVEKERRLFSPQKELMSKQLHESFDEIGSSKVVNTDMGKKTMKKPPAINKKSKLSEPSEAKIKVANINVIKPNKTLNSKDSKYSFEKIKAKNIINKKIDRLSPRGGTGIVKKDSLTSPTGMITNVVAKPTRTKLSTTNKSKADKTKSIGLEKESSESIMKTSLTQFTKTEKVDLFIQDGVEYDKVSEGWMISPMNKIPVKASKIIPEKNNTVRNGYRSLPKYMNLKYVFI